MTELLIYILAFVWGGIWAAFIQFVPIGRFLARKRTWITVVIGVGVDLIIALAIVDKETWLKIVAIITLSSVFIIVRSLANESREAEELLHGIENEAR
jgi:hypothetical protein